MKNKSQIWIETVIYTLIGLAIIALLLSIVKPAIDRKKDQILLESSLDMMRNIEVKIEDVKYYGVGNARTLEVKIKKGKLEINAENDTIKFMMESKFKYSEPEVKINMGNIEILTTEKNNGFDTSFVLDYRGSLNLTWNSKDISQTFQPAPTPYIINLRNDGRKGDLIQINFS